MIRFGPLACRSENSRREQTQALLSRIASLDLRAPPELRAQQIAGLRGLSLTDEGLARVRDRCVQAHAGLLSAEQEQATARKGLDAVEGSPTRDPATLQTIAASVSHAQVSLRDAQGALVDCQSSLRSLLGAR